MLGITQGSLETSDTDLAHEPCQEHAMLPNAAVAPAMPPLSDEVREFCERHALFDRLAKALELAREHFTIVGEPVVKWEHDPENDDEYLVIEIQVQGSVSENVEAEWRFAGGWTQFARLPEVRLIRLDPDLV
jgi:hypothetical protein